MTTIEYATVVSSISAVVYTICTFMLLYTSKKSTDYVKHQITLLTDSNSSNSKSMESTAYHSIINGHRDLFIPIISNNDLLSILARDIGVPVQEAREMYLASLLINHVSRIYTDLYRTNLLSPQEVESFIFDARELYRKKFVRKRWDYSCNCYSSAFSTFVADNLITSEQPEN